METFFGNSPEIQVAFITGYLSYRLASAGLDRAHKTIDVIFQTLTYGLITHVIYIALNNVNFGFGLGIKSEFWVIICSVVLTFVIAGFWRAKWRAVLISLLQKRILAKESLAPSTWDGILNAPYKWAYVSVTCDDGKTYESDISSLPDGLPFETLEADQHGNIALYVTRTIEADGRETDYGPEGARDGYGRANITYLPVSVIEKVDVSFVD